MPGFTTHYLFGQQTYQLLKASGLKQAIQKRHTVYALGLQGPDIFFYDLLSLLSAKKNPGSIAHTANTRKFLRYLLESPKIFLTKNEQLIAQIYVLGFIGHYLLDTVCHPYIYAMTHYSQQPKGYIGQHIQLETDIDATLLWRCQHRLPSEFHQNESIALTKKQRAIVSALLSYTFTQTYPGLHITRKRILQAIFAMQTGTRLLYDPTGRKKKLLRHIEFLIPGYPLLSSLVPSDTLILRADPCNTKHAPWHNPWDRDLVSTESFFELFEKAQKEYGILLNSIAHFYSQEHTETEEREALHKLLSHLGNLCYHSGLSAATYLS